MKKITVIGGGTGSFTILTGLKKLKNIHLTSIVPSTDSGGSTGILRDEFGYLPIGDIRQCLVALAEDETDQIMLRKLFMYRFDRGESGLKGHNFGNIFLTALTEVLNGNQIEAIKMAQKLLNIQGNVYPVTLDDCHLVAEYENGEKVVGEHYIDAPQYPHDGRLKIKKLYSEPKAKIYKEVNNCIKNSDAIVMGPGDLYTSLLANVVTGNLGKVIRNSQSKFIYVLNLVTKFGQTYGFKASDHLKEIERYIGRKPDYILVNSSNLPEDILERYRMQNDYPVENDLDGSYNVVQADLLANETIVTPKGDKLKRSLIRHDGDKVAKVVQKILN
jgi:uncharacterized cofD-like protein